MRTMPRMGRSRIVRLGSSDISSDNRQYVEGVSQTETDANTTDQQSIVGHWQEERS